MYHKITKAVMLSTCLTVISETFIDLLCIFRRNRRITIVKKIKLIIKNMCFLFSELKSSKRTVGKLLFIFN